MRFLILFLFLAAQGWGATYYIAKGACAADCDGTSWAKAWDDFAGGTSNISWKAGANTYYVAAGTYSIFSVGQSGVSATERLVIRRATAAVNGSDAGWNAAYDGTVLISGAGIGINTNGKSYLEIQGLSFATTNYAVWMDGGAQYISLIDIDLAGCLTGVNILSADHVLVDGVTNSAPIAGSYAIRAFGPTTNIEIKNVDLDGLTKADGNGGIAIWVEATGAAETVSLENIAIANATSGGIVIYPVTGSTISMSNIDISTVGTLAGSPYKDGIAISGGLGATGITLAADDITVDAAGGQGFYVHATTFATGSSVDNISVSNSGSFGIGFISGNNLSLSNGTITGGTDGVNLMNSSDNTVTNFVVTNVGRDGIALHGTSEDNLFDFCEVYGAGQSDVVANGDGFTAHDDCFNNTIRRCIASGNRNTAFAMVGTSTGSILNCIAYENGDASSVNMGVRGGFYNSATGAWVVKNTIFKGNYPNEVRITAAALAASTFDNNLYYHAGNDSVEADGFSVDGGVTSIAWAAYQIAASGFAAGDEAHSVYGDPKFRSTSDFHLLPTSPAINAGVGVGLTTDIEGRAIRGLPDIGAYEFQMPHSRRIIQGVPLENRIEAVPNY